MEVVATDGPVTQPRRDELLQLAAGSVFQPQHVAFVTAFADRCKMTKRFMSSLAWGTFAWYASEPEGLVGFHRSDGTPLTLHALLLQLPGTRS